MNNFGLYGGGDRGIGDAFFEAPRVPQQYGAMLLIVIYCTCMTLFEFL